MATVSFEGCALSYRVQGSGPAVLLIQGVAVQGGAWVPQTDDLARDYTCITFDNRGMGVSQPAATAISVGRLIPPRCTGTLADRRERQGAGVPVHHARL